MSDATPQKVADLEQRVFALETSTAVGKVHYDNLNTRLTSIEKSINNLVRTILGAIVVAFMAYYGAGGLVLP